MTREMADALRRQFPPEQVGKLPRGGQVLDYVGHADVTSRLLEADPAWNWEPLAKDESGLPLFDLADNGKPVGLWIRLTVGGVTRLGYGSVPSNQNDAVKVLIGDALRNAAMRFGVAIDLWAKGDRADPTVENATAPAGHAVRGSRAAAAPRQARTPASAKPTAAKAASEPLSHLQAIQKAVTSTELNKAWEAIAAEGKLEEHVILDGGEKLTYKELLFKRNNELKHNKSGAPAAEHPGGSGDQ
jgi:hypothetical protein